MNRCLRTIALLACTLPFELTGRAQGFPDRPVTVIVPYSAGGVSDLIAREVAAHMAQASKQTVTVDNRPGGGAQIAMGALKGAPADGYTVFIGDMGPLAMNVGLFTKLNYDPRKDLQPITQLVESPLVLVVANDSPYKTFGELVQAAKTNPKGLSYASQGIGTGGHLFGTLLSKRLDVALTHTPYRGSQQGLADVMGNQVDMMYDAIATSGPLVRGAKLRGLAIGAKKRSPLLPDVPTLKELGYEEVGPSFWWGAVVRTGTPAPVVERLNKLMVDAITDPAVSKKFMDMGLEIVTSSPKSFEAFMGSEITRWTKVVKDAGMTIE